MIFWFDISPLKGETTLKCARRLADDFFVERYNQAVVRLDDGRPTISGAEISISHTGNRMAVMVAHAPCGVDIEYTDRAAAHLWARFASQKELSIAFEVYNDNAPLLIWCAKEAIFKFLQRRGVDLLADIKIVGAMGDTITANAFGAQVSLKWGIDNNMLIVHTL